MKTKSIFLLGSLAVLLFTSCESSSEVKEADVPQSVKSAFNTKYPTALVTKWETEKKGGKMIYEAKFKDGGKEKEVHITADGSSVTDED
jgi:uncharacterized membrane protein YkoI